MTILKISPKQNRVTPYGELVSNSERGMFMGNRGILHDENQSINHPMKWKSISWIYCSLSYKGKKREIMGTGKYTELFFLDEATALAAGHRPCFRCLREKNQEFFKIWLLLGFR